ncbi:MAG: putative zinc-binding protein [Methanomicrobium sp.]|nr:putative zinc-binding protein [Methanomicrobium sp.]
MAENPKCSCGQNEKNRIIFPCAGQANTGQITNLAAIELTEEGYGSIACVALLATGAKGIIENSKKADEIVVLDGCPMNCAKKIAQAQRINVDQHLVMTELGITKGASKSYNDDDIEIVVSACWEGKGKTGDGKPEKCSDENSGNTCGCGGSCRK